MLRKLSFAVERVDRSTEGKASGSTRTQAPGHAQRPHANSVAQLQLLQYSLSPSPVTPKLYLFKGLADTCCRRINGALPIMHTSCQAV